MSPTLEPSGTGRKGLVERACFADSQPWWSGDARVPALVVFVMALRGCEQLVVLHVPDRLRGRPSRNAGQVHDQPSSCFSGNLYQGSQRVETEGDIVNCENDPGKLGSLSVSSYSPYSMKATHSVPLKPLA